MLIVFYFIFLWDKNPDAFIRCSFASKNKNAKDDVVEYQHSFFDN